MSKKLFLKNVQFFEATKNLENLTHSIEAEGLGNIEVSDGYHTMDELYEHRIALFIALLRTKQDIDDMENARRTVPIYSIWRSETHSDGTKFDGWFILGIGKETGKQISYHLPLSKWSETDFVETLDRAPEWDGHTPSDVLERLKNL